MLKPRNVVLSKDITFMSIAILASARSKDPSTQVGACLVSEDGRIIGTGYNGFPRGIDSDALPWDKTADKPDETKYLYVAHAEENAVANCDKNRLNGSIIYTTLFPCNKCSIILVQNQVSEIVYLSDKYHDLPETRASRKILDLAGIPYRQFQSVANDICINLKTGQWICK
jgi:dCMP deaminase